MKLGLMQPYLFPYIGYFQLIRAVDCFVIHDDVQWIKGGWINRNRILVNGEARFVTIPVAKASSFSKINERVFSDDYAIHARKILRTVESIYRKAPYFEPAFEVLRQCLSQKERNASLFITNALRLCCRYLSIDTPFVLSSQIEKDNALSGQARVISINKVMGSSHYINPVGGMDLYRNKDFAGHGIRLSFLKSEGVCYRQFPGQEFIPSLSIIDVMMFNSRGELSDLLLKYELIDAASHVRQ